MAWIYLAPLEGGIVGQFQGICEDDDDLTAAESEAVICLNRYEKLGVGSVALCLETGAVSVMGADGNWTGVGS